MLRWAVPIVGYHRVGEAKGDHVPTVSAQAFEQQMAYLARHRYTVLDLPEVAQRVQAGQPIPRKSVVITFDDGYEETATVAGPILHRHGFRATVFVTPSEVGLPGFMTWPQVKEIASNGLTIGSHTMHHTYLPMVSHEKAQQELAESKRTLETQLGHAVEWLSYPVGGYTSAIQELARGVGYRGACTTNRGTDKWKLDLYALRRIKMTEADQHPLLLRAKLSGFYDCFRTLHAPA